MKVLIYFTNNKNFDPKLWNGIVDIFIIMTDYMITYNYGLYSLQHYMFRLLML